MKKKLLPGGIGLAILIALVALYLHFFRTGKTWITTVGPNANQIGTDPLTITTKDQVQWNATDPSKSLYIEFDQYIFKNSKQQADQRYLVTCRGGTCDSGPLVSPLPAQPSGGYKYWQALENAPTSNPVFVDGHIIIKQ